MQRADVCHPNFYLSVNILWNFLHDVNGFIRVAIWILEYDGDDVNYMNGFI